MAEQVADNAELFAIRVQQGRVAVSEIVETLDGLP